MGGQTALAYDPQDFERLLVSRENVGDVGGKPASFRRPSSRPFKTLPRPSLLSVANIGHCNARLCIGERCGDVEEITRRQGDQSAASATEIAAQGASERHRGFCGNRG
jgi:hypothetical protein